MVKVVEAGVQKGGGKDERRCEAMAIRDRDRSCFACGEMAAAIPNGEFGLSGFDSEHLTWEMCIHTKKPNRESMRLDRSPVCVRCCFMPMPVLVGASRLQTQPPKRIHTKMPTHLSRVVPLTGTAGARGVLQLPQVTGLRNLPRKKTCHTCHL